MKSEKFRKTVENIIYPLSLILLPLLTVNQGVDVSDSTYSLGNYMFAEGLEGMWVISTYLSNVLGALIVRLPGANRLLVANIYTGLILAVVALVAYYALKREFEAAYVFLGECIAVCLCWIPTGILYNYASYLFMTIGAILLLEGIVKNNSKLLFAAGIVLGLNVFVRIPNITQMALILMLWTEGIVAGRKLSDVAAKTGVCVGGYAVGLVIPLAAILSQYGFAGISNMISGLTGITSTDATYTPLSMIMDTLGAYVISARWLAVILAVILGGVVLYRIFPDRYTVVKTVIYLGVIAVMIRFFWGRGMFSFRYYEDYTAMYEWGMMALFLSLITDVYAVVGIGKRLKKSNNGNGIDKDRTKFVLAVMSLIIIAIAPLGSNNSTYQNLNNMFLVMPITVVLSADMIKKISSLGRRFVTFPIGIMVYAVLLCLLVQSFGFNMKFVFRDGMRGEARDTQIEKLVSLKGMYTNRERAESLEGLGEYIETIHPDAMVLFGDCPGLTYIFGVPSALFTSWADLDSNPVEMIDEDLQKISVMQDENIPVIIRKTELSGIHSAEKLDIIMDFIAENDYMAVYDNSEYTVYRKD